MRLFRWAFATGCFGFGKLKSLRRVTSQTRKNRQWPVPGCIGSLCLASLMVRIVLMAMALHFLSGANKGKEFPLPEDRELVLARTDDNDVVVDDAKGPRPHAVVTFFMQQVVIKDLATGRGTLVNGKSVQEAILNEGDRIRIGRATLMLVTLTRFSAALQETGGQTEVFFGVQSRSKGPGKEIPEAARSIGGSIKEVPLADLLQFLCRSGKSGVLTINSPPRIGHIFLREGHVYYASINDGSKVHPRRTLHRLLRWMEGSFKLDPPDPRRVDIEITDSSESVILEGLRQADELVGMKTLLPKPEDRLQIRRPLPGKLGELSPGELQIFQLVLDCETAQAVIDGFPEDDWQACAHLVSLLSRGFVETAAPAH
jgi:pSer/pThr/pTyr-binding forkhead associated (FHA) protein